MGDLDPQFGNAVAVDIEGADDRAVRREVARFPERPLRREAQASHRTGVFAHEEVHPVGKIDDVAVPLPPKVRYGHVVDANEPPISVDIQIEGAEEPQRRWAPASLCLELIDSGPECAPYQPGARALERLAAVFAPGERSASGAPIRTWPQLVADRPRAGPPVGHLAS